MSGLLNEIGGPAPVNAGGRTLRGFLPGIHMEADLGAGAPAGLVEDPGVPYSPSEAVAAADLGSSEPENVRLDDDQWGAALLAYDQALETGDEETLAALDDLLFGGDSEEPESVSAWLESLSPAQLQEVEQLVEAASSEAIERRLAEMLPPEMLAAVAQQVDPTLLQMHTIADEQMRDQQAADQIHGLLEGWRPELGDLDADRVRELGSQLFPLAAAAGGLNRESAEQALRAASEMLATERSGQDAAFAAIEDEAKLVGLHDLKAADMTQAYEYAEAILPSLTREYPTQADAGREAIRRAVRALSGRNTAAVPARLIAGHYSKRGAEIRGKARADAHATGKTDAHPHTRAKPLSRQELVSKYARAASPHVDRRHAEQALRTSPPDSRQAARARVLLRNANQRGA